MSETFLTMTLTKRQTIMSAMFNRSSANDFHIDESKFCRLV